MVRQRIRRLLPRAVALAVTAVALAAPTTSNAATRVTIESLSLNGVACPTPSRCVAVGGDPDGNGTSATVDVPNGATTVWPGKITNDVMDSVACPTPTTCLAVSANVAASVNVSSGAMTTTATVPPPKGEIVSMSELACAGSAGCYAAGFEGTESASKDLVVHLSGSGREMGTVESTSSGISAIACPSSTQCLMGVHDRNGQEWLQLLNKGAFGKAHLFPPDTIVENIACYNSVVCYALAGSSLFSINPNTGVVGAKLTLGTFDGSRVACASPVECVVVGETSAHQSGALPITSGKAGRIIDLPVDPSAIACATPKVCVVVGQVSSGADVDVLDL